MNKSNTVQLAILSALTLAAAVMSPAQADTTLTNYPGLMCQPHDPTSAEYAYGTFTDIYNITATAGNDLGMNCSIPRNQGDKELKSVTVIVRDSDATLGNADPNLSTTFCHTHNETLRAGDIDYVFGPDVSTFNVNGNYNAVTVPGPGAPASSTTNFNLHCHIGVGASLHNYATSVRR